MSLVKKFQANMKDQEDTSPPGPILRSMNKVKKERLTFSELSRLYPRI